MKLTPAILGKMKYWSRYVDRQMFQGRRVYKGTLQGWKEAYKRRFEFDVAPPWTEEFRKLNKYNPKQRKVKVHYVEPLHKWPVFKGDRVEVLVGPDKGKQGIVNHIVKERNWVFVSGLHRKYMVQGGELVAIPQPLLVTTQVDLVDPQDKKPCEIEWRFDEAGNEVRVSKRTGIIIPKSVLGFELEDHVNPKMYEENPDTDTPVAEVKKETFKPAMKTFDQSLMESLGIVEVREKAKTYWY